MILVWRFLFIFLSFNILGSEYITVFNQNNESSKILLTEGVGPTGVKEVRGDATGFPKIIKGLNPILFYGRDLDHNGNIETWFFLHEEGVRVVIKEGKLPLGQDVLPEILKAQFQSSAKLYFSTATMTILSYLFFTADEVKSEKARFYLDWINLEELNIRISNEEKRSTGIMNKNQLEFQKLILHYGFSKLHEEMQQFHAKDLFGYIAADVGIWLTGGVIIKWGGKLLSTPLKMLTESSFFKFLSENIGRIFETQKEVIATKLESASSKLGKTKEKTKQNLVKLTPKNWRQNLTLSLNAQNLKLKILSGGKAFYQGVKSEWRYIVLNSSIQATAEGMSRFQEIKDPNPFVMAKNLFSNPEVQQNMGFMAIDTVLMTGVSKNLKTMKAKFMASAFIAITNSTLINVFIKKENDPNRIIVDTGWEAIIGNGQVQIDLLALNYFEKLGQKNNNPNLKLLGYAVVLVDQGIGYYTYSKISEKSDSLDDQFKKVLVPIVQAF